MSYNNISGEDLEKRARLIAFYLPQFHEIPENNEWWGKGFTEWTNVRKAKPLFSGHVQPKIPGELGYYNLLDQQARAAQAKLAKENGIEAFCYWHYWFGNGRRLLEKPLSEVLRLADPEIGFCLCWANQTWTGIWHGAPNRVLIEQQYPGKSDEAAYFESVLPAFRDKRYVTIEGRPLFAIYKPEELPDAAGFIQHWNKLAQECGLKGIYFVGMSNNFSSPELKFFDAIVPIGPGDFLDIQPKDSLVVRGARRLLRGKLSKYIPKSFLGRIGLPFRHDYGDAAAQAFARLPDSDTFYPCVLTGWDNTPRSGYRGVVFENYTPNALGVALSKAINYVSGRNPEKRIVFLKSWNEWAEGNHLEPESREGRAYLNVVREINFRK